MTRKNRSTALVWGWICGALTGVLMIWDAAERFLQIQQIVPWWGWLIFLVATPCFLALHFYRKSSALQQRLPSTITLFLPLENSGADSRRDGKSQLDGIAQFISKECDLTQQIHLKVVDSSLPRTEADNLNDAERRTKRTKRLIELVAKEYRSGCRYFFCTMSQVLADFAPEFKKWAETLKDKPKLVTTVAAAPLELDRDLIFRYYPRAKDEATPLAEWMNANNIKHAIVVRVDSLFGEALEAALKHECSNRDISCIFLPALQGRGIETADKIRSQLTEQIRQHSGEKDHCCIVLVLYGQSLTKTIEAINGISIPLKVASTSTLTTEIASGHKLSAAHKWVLCRPVLRSRNNFDEDVIAFYVHAALERYANCIVACKEEKSVDFAVKWTKLDTDEEVHWETNGHAIDSCITMKVVAHSPS